MAYIGYFRSLQTDILYSVTLKKADDTSTPTEITLAGTSPFVVRYEESSTPFEGIRNSTATINIISDNYFEDILPSAPRETEVILKDETNGVNKWIGYLTSKVYSQPYENCLESIQLEASDCISSMQYIDYESKQNRGIITFKDLIINIIDDTLLQGFYWPKTKQFKSNYLYPEDIAISEKNFFSSDTDEPWDCQEIIKQMCTYLGMTAIQSGEYLYFGDYTALNHADKFQFAFFPKATDYAESTSKYSGVGIRVTEDDIMGNGENISFEPIVNKITVKDNFYTCDYFISNIFDDNLLTNRGSEFFSSFEVPAVTPAATFPCGTGFFSQKYVSEEPDDNYLYFHRLYDHSDYESVYRNKGNLTRVYPTGYWNTRYVTKDYVGGTIMDLGIVKKDYVDDLHQTIIANAIDWERYICICQLGNGWLPLGGYAPNYPQDNMVIFKTKDGTTGQVLMEGANSYLIIDYKILFTRYQDRNYINPDWSSEETKMSWILTGTEIRVSGNLVFRLCIGGQYWNGESWQDTSCVFAIPCGKEEAVAYINTERSVLNNVSWDLNINEEGYKIPLAGIDTSGEIIFEMFLPNLQTITDYNGLTPTKYNGYCWVKDLVIKTATIGQDAEVEESDVVYENIIDDNNVNEVSEIGLKFTTSVPFTRPSYSNVIYKNGTKNTFLTTITEEGLSSIAQKPEENIIERYYQQYSTPTKKLSYKLNLDFGVFDKLYGLDMENPDTGYVTLGGEIDYATDTQEITLIEKK